jgi:hypothetical protein
VVWWAQVPVVSLPLFSIVVGLLLSWSARGREGNGSPRGGSLVMLYTLVVHAPACATLLALNPDWSCSYVVSPGRLQTALVLGSSLSTAAAVPLGFLLGKGRSRTRHTNPLLWATALFCSIATNTLLFIAPLTRDATFVEYHNDFGVQGLAGSALGYSLIWAVVALGCALVFTHTHLRRFAQEHRALPAPFFDSDA